MVFSTAAVWFPIKITILKLNVALAEERILGVCRCAKAKESWMLRTDVRSPWDCEEKETQGTWFLSLSRHLPVPGSGQSTLAVCVTIILYVE